MYNFSSEIWFLFSYYYGEFQEGYTQGGIATLLFRCKHNFKRQVSPFLVKDHYFISTLSASWASPASSLAAQPTQSPYFTRWTSHHYLSFCSQAITGGYVTANILFNGDKNCGEDLEFLTMFVLLDVPPLVLDYRFPTYTRVSNL